MLYVLIAIILFAAMLGYFRIARWYNIIDKPNERSSHTQVTIRGAGVVFYLGALAWFIISGGANPYFFTGLSIIMLISFLDDILDLSNSIRISVHLLSTILLFYEVKLFDYTWWLLPIVMILIMGTINAYNFMDGINGITAMYSFAVLLLLWMANQEIGFFDDRLLYYISISNGVFAFFNFRKQAKCFAGDVGSVGICFILVFATMSLVLSTGNPIYLMFFAVYGIDTVFTIVFRLLRQENIFKAHRTHLYQYLANEAKGNQLVIATCYAILQVGVGSLILIADNYPATTQIGSVVCILVLLTCLYLVLRAYILKDLLIKTT